MAAAIPWRALWAFLPALLLACGTPALGADIIVGGSQGWTLGVDYKNLIAEPGDVLVSAWGGLLYISCLSPKRDHACQYATLSALAVRFRSEEATGPKKQPTS